MTEYAVRNEDGSIVLDNAWRSEADVIASYHASGYTDNGSVTGALLSRPDAHSEWQEVHPINDPVSHPAHYTWLGGIEVIDITEHLGFCMGNVIKYVLRADHKGKPIEDLEKAKWYLEREIARRRAAL